MFLLGELKRKRVNPLRCFLSARNAPNGQQAKFNP